MSKGIKLINIAEYLYNNLLQKDPNAIYIFENGEVRKGDFILAELLIEVEELPLAPDPSKIYMLPSLEGYMYKNDEWKKILAPVSTISTSYTMFFNITSSLTNGPQAIPCQAPNDGTIESISVITTTTGTEETVIDIEKASETDLDNGTGYSTIFTSGNEIKIPIGKYSNKTATPYVLVDNNINKGDALRLNILNNGSGISGLSLQIRVNLK